MSICAACTVPLRVGTPCHGTYRIGSNAVIACSVVCGKIALVGALIGMPAQKRGIDAAELENPPAKSIARTLPPDRASDLVRVQQWRNRVQAFLDATRHTTSTYDVKTMLVTIGVPIDQNEIRARLVALIAKLDELADAISSMADYDLGSIEIIAHNIITDMTQRELLDDLRSRGALDATSRLVNRFPADLPPIVAQFVRGDEDPEPLASIHINKFTNARIVAFGNSYIYVDSSINGTVMSFDYAGNKISRMFTDFDENMQSICMEPANAHADGELWCVTNPTPSIRFYQGNRATQAPAKNIRDFTCPSATQILLDAVRNQALTVLEINHGERFEFVVYDLVRNEQPTLRARYDNVSLFDEATRKTITKLTYHFHNGRVIVVATVRNVFKLEGMFLLVTIVDLESQTIRRVGLPLHVFVRIFTSEWLVFHNTAAIGWYGFVVATPVNSIEGALSKVYVIAVNALPLSNPISFADVGTERDSVIFARHIESMARMFNNWSRQPPFLNRNRLYLTRNIFGSPAHAANIVDTYFLD